MAALFWITLVVAANWALALIRTIINPEWYHYKAAQAGVMGDVRRFVYVKLVQLALCAAILIWAGNEAGYLFK